MAHVASQGSNLIDIGLANGIEALARAVSVEPGKALVTERAVLALNLIASGGPSYSNAVARWRNVTAFRHKIGPQWQPFSCMHLGGVQQCRAVKPELRIWVGYAPGLQCLGSLVCVLLHMHFQFSRAHLHPGMLPPVPRVCCHTHRAAYVPAWFMSIHILLLQGAIFISTHALLLQSATSALSRACQGSALTPAWSPTRVRCRTWGMRTFADRSVATQSVLTHS